MTIHELKCWPVYFEPLATGEKTAEIRKNDRDFKVGDILRLREWSPGRLRYTGRDAYRKITHILELDEVVSGPDAHNYVLLSLGEPKQEAKP